MKKLCIIAAITLAAAVCVADQKSIVSVPQPADGKMGTLRAAINTQFANSQANFVELYATTSALTSSLSTKASSSCFANASAMSACFPSLSIGGDDLGSATSSSVVALFPGTGDCLGANGQKVACGNATGGITHANSDGSYYASRNGVWANLTGVFAPPLGSDDNYVTDAEKTKLSNLSGTNTGDQDLSSYTTSSSVLTKTNTTAFTPTTDYHPATKKYVDDSITASGGYTDEQAQDAVGGMFTGNTETGIAVTYDDTTGKVNFVVSGGSMTWPVTAGVAVYGGSSAWGTSLTVGTGANNLVQLNSSSQLPAVSGALLTDTFTGTLISGQTTHKGAIQAIASELDNAVEITAGTGITLSSGVVSVTANTYQAYDADWLGITANGASLVSAANYAAMKTLLDIDDIQTLTGIAAGTAHLGTFTGTTIADSSTIKTGMQSLETAVEGKQAALTLGTGVSTALSNNAGAVGGFPVIIGSGATAMSGDSVAANTCSTAVAVSATGVATTDTIIATPNAILSTVAGYGVTSAGALRIDVYPTANKVNFQLCNPTDTTIDPDAITINWKVIR